MVVDRVEDDVVCVELVLLVTVAVLLVDVVTVSVIKVDVEVVNVSELVVVSLIVVVVEFVYVLVTASRRSSCSELSSAATLKSKSKRKCRIPSAKARKKPRE